MFRRLLTAILLLPLSLNGLWMVCSEAEASEPAAAVAESAGQQIARVAEAKPECKGNAMCPLHKPAPATAKQDTPRTQSALMAENHQEGTGAICLLSPDGSGVAIAAIGFVYAPPAAVQLVLVSDNVEFTPQEFASITYLDADPPHATPPPKA